MTGNKLDVRVYPMEELKGGTLAYASVVINGMIAIRGIRVVMGKNGAFVLMPRSRDKNGEYRDLAFPLTGDLRKEISGAVLDEFDRQISLPAEQSGYDQPAQSAESDGSAEGARLDARVYPIKKPLGNVHAFASVGFDEAVAIRGIRVISGEDGLIVSMPRAKDKNGKTYEVAFPISSDLRNAVNAAILTAYKAREAEMKQSIGGRLADGAERAERRAADTVPDQPAAKKAPGLGE